MRRAAAMALVIGLLVGGLVGGLVTAPPAARAAATSGSRMRHLGGVAVRLHPGTRQVVTVRHTQGWHAVVQLWAIREGHWTSLLTARDGRTGAGGLVADDQRRQGTDTTPLGTYRLLSAFGTHARAASWRLPYRRIARGDFWVEDNTSKYYNRYRNQRRGGFHWRLPASAVNGSERLSDYPVQYEYAIVTSFNHDQVRHRGAGIFLHVNGSGATGGCVSAPRRFLRAVLGNLKPADHPLIAIGT